MTTSELEAKYLPHVLHVCGLLLMPAAEAIRLLEDCQTADVALIGVEAFRVLDGGGVQPGIEFSNISYGTVNEIAGEPKFQPDLRLRIPWDSDPQALRNTQALIAEGLAGGYPWYEVSLEDPRSNDLLFFRQDT